MFTTVSIIAAIGILVSYTVTFLILRFERTHAFMSLDHDLQGTQKFHTVPVPRIGGIAILSGLLASFVVLALSDSSIADLYGKVILCALPAFLSGIVEDFTKRVSVKVRLVATGLSAMMAYIIIGAILQRTEIPFIDALIHFTPVALVITVVCVAGVANSINIIDGFNGLATLVSVIILTAIAVVAMHVNDTFVFAVATFLAGALLGFFPWNFPGGRIFLGDGGAYMVGYLIAVLAVLLVQRNPSVSPWCPMLIVMHPVFETMFSVYRRILVRRVSPGAPDAFHLHQLVYKRLVRVTGGASTNEAKTRRNSLTSPYIWGMNLLAAIPATFLYDNNAALQACCVTFAMMYIVFYRMIVHFRIPVWFVLRSELPS